MLATGALVASILAVGAGPTAAQPASTLEAATPDHNPEFGAHWSACVGAAGTHDQMFDDVNDDNVHAGDINCIAYYGITVGIGDGTYAPDDHVTAFQMRLFVQRAADLMGADDEAVLGGVMLSDTVTRLEMAKLMFGLVDDIDGGVRIGSDGQIQFRNENNQWVVVNDYFDDVKNLAPIADSQLVGAIYELGITRGTRGDGTRVSTPDSRFEPSAPVTRAQMASFIARTLDHSNLRPEGLTIQRNNRQDTLVSLRDADFEPIEDARVDVFSSLYPGDAFDADGECVGRFVKDETPSHDVCAIDIGDQLTDDEGNVEFQLASDTDPITAGGCTVGGQDITLRFDSAPGSTARTHWAWTGDDGDKVDADTTRAELEQVSRPVGADAPDYLRITGGLPTNSELAAMGETVTFEAQLYDQVGDAPNADKDVAVGPDRSRNPYHLTITYQFVGASDTTPHTAEAEQTTGQTWTISDKLPGDWDFLNVLPSGTPSVRASSDTAQAFRTSFDSLVWPNPDGRFEINLDNIDTDAANNNDDVLVRFTLRPFRPGNDRIDANLVHTIVADNVNHAAGVDSPRNPLASASGYALFSDDPADPSVVTGESSTYRIVSGNRTGNSVTVKVTDQYGDGMRNVEVSVKSDLDMVARATDEANYPEQVDVTVQENENGDGSTGDTRGVVDLVNPTTVRTSLTGATIEAAIAVYDGTASTQQFVDVTVGLRVNADDGTTITEVPTDDVIGTFRTRRNGEYRIGYSYTGTSAQTEEITPQSVQVTHLRATPTSATAATLALRQDDPATTDVETDRAIARAADVGDPVKVYFAKTGNNAESHTDAASASPTEAVPVLVRDVANQTIVVNESILEETDDVDNPMAYFYDEDDTFIIEGVGATFEMFEEALSATYKDDKIYAHMVEWENYSTSRPGRVNRTIWRLSLNCGVDPSTLQLHSTGNAWEDI